MRHNLEIARLSDASSFSCTVQLVLFLVSHSVMADFKEKYKEIFNAFCRDNYLCGSGKNTSKTVNLDKAKRIRQVLRGENMDLYYPSFRFWVKKTTSYT